MVIGKQCRPRSVPTLFASNTGISIKHSYNKNLSDTLLLETDWSKLTRLIVVCLNLLENL